MCRRRAHHLHPERPDLAGVEVQTQGRVGFKKGILNLAGTAGVPSTRTRTTGAPSRERPLFLTPLFLTHYS